MPSGFSKLYYKIEQTNVQLMFEVLISYYKRHGFLLENKKGNIPYIDYLGDLHECQYNEIISKLHSQDSISFFLTSSTNGQLYMRIKKSECLTLIEEYNFSWLPQFKERVFILKLITDRMKEMTLSKENEFQGGVIDLVGYTENFNWDALFRYDTTIQEVDNPTIVCFNRHKISIFHSGLIKDIGDFRMLFFDSPDLTANELFNQ